MSEPKKDRPILFCGDPHGRFSHILEAAGQTKASAVVLLGDMEPAMPLHLELKPILERVWWIPGNHDSDSDMLWRHVFGSDLVDRNVHGRVVALPDGTRLAGLGGVFRESVWYPSSSAARGGAPAFRSRVEHATSTPSQDRWGGTGPHRKHWGSIYPDELDKLADLRADILITHEAPGYHPNGFDILDTLAQTLGVKMSIHGHHHDALDSSSRWAAQGFESRGVGLRGISARWPDGRWEVVVKGELDDHRGRYRTTWP
jgi:predicted phosphodiesterase